jgi:hypothetical protein
MELSSVLLGEGSSFGPGETIALTGAVPFLTHCEGIDRYNRGGRAEAPKDFFPVADIYIVNDDGKPLVNGAVLSDVRGKPNRIVGLSGGMFYDEPIATTMPAGTLGAGRYKVVMNQCLTGVYDDRDGDIVLGQSPALGFDVLLPQHLAQSLSTPALVR